MIVSRTTARVFRNRRSQLVRLPKGFQFEGNEVSIRREGDAVVLSARPADWSDFLASELSVSDEFVGRLAEICRTSLA